MNRLEKHFAELKTRGQKAAIFFITAGDPSLKETLEIMQTMSDNGADCIELGMPFSDPIADGPVIRRATARALKNHVTIKDILDLVREFRKYSRTPVVLMGYYNPLIRYGIEALVRDCAAFGVDGLIVADLPFEEGEELERLAKASGVNLIYLLAPDIDPARTEAILRASGGFVHCVAQYSTTGVESSADSVLPETIKSLQDMTSLPVAVGFGISSLEKVREMSETADGVIIGSWLLKELEKARDKAKTAAAFVSSVKSALAR